MENRKLIVAFGTRPEAIKLAPVIHELRRDIYNFEVKIVSTGQHAEMLQPILDFFQITPDFNLEALSRHNNLSSLTAYVLQEVKQIIDSFAPDLVIVHGDTTSAYATALAAFYSCVDLAHVEAGLRTFDMFSPYPEEFNRRSISSVARFHFAPTSRARKNLIDEGVESGNVVVTGNTVVDALLMTQALVNQNRDIHNAEYCLVNKHVLQNRRFVLITGHRRENFGKGFENICKAILQLARRFPELTFLYPVHLNPYVRSTVFEALKSRSNIVLTDPLDYQTFVNVLSSSLLVMTDSGGIQEEAPVFGIPVVILRDKTERPEVIESGCAKLAGVTSKSIVDCVAGILEDDTIYSEMANAPNPFGSGQASELICKFLSDKL